MMCIRSLCLLVLSSAILPGMLLAQGNGLKRPTTPIDEKSCVTQECHAAVKAMPTLHAPVATDDCMSCHEVASVEKHTFSLAREKAELCTYCHEFSVEQMPVVHEPVKQGECLGCHNPHGGANRSFTLEATMPELCGRCHQDVMVGKDFLHGPVAEGACDSCHAPHAAKFDNLLDAVGTDMCLTCHTEMIPALAKAKLQHKAMEDGCDTCHDAHGSRLPMSLPMPMTELCFSCHVQIKDRIASASVKHSAVSDDRACMNCHSPHASNVLKLQKDVTVTTCMSCHDKPIKLDETRTVAAVKEVVDPKLHKHGEIRDGSCSGCHDVHGGSRADLLTRPYMREFFQQFSPDNVALCFPCHDVQLVEQANTTRATRFRNGEQNLHYVHANFGNRYKNCRTCHASHAAGNDRLIRETFTFGKRELPVRFTRTETGGTCLPGCHADYSYDRENPISSEDGEVADRPALVGIPRALYQETRKVAWTTHDINGREVNVPAGVGGATAIVLVSSEDAEAASLLGKLRMTAESVRSNAAFVVVVGGKLAEKKSAEIASAAGDWAVISDADNLAGDALDAHGWPMMVLLDAAGVEMARVAGDGDLLATRVRAYLRLAAGQISPDELTSELSPAPLPEADTATRKARDIRAARLLISQGKAKEALACIEEVADRTPDVQLIRAKALAMLDRPDDALQILNRMKADDAHAIEMTLIRARAWISMERWYQARPLLEQFVKENPGVAEAHMLLGRIYEHDQNWPAAAQQYKAASEARK